jgi:hypothetical protein
MKVNICYPGKGYWSFDLEVEDLEDVFSQFNHGSGNECKQFVDNRMRSLSVSNYVVQVCCLGDKKRLRSFR